MTVTSLPEAVKVTTVPEAVTVEPGAVEVKVTTLPDSVTVWITADAVLAECQTGRLS